MGIPNSEDYSITLLHTDIGARAPRRSEEGRVCIEYGCDTILSVYNNGEKCYIHDSSGMKYSPSLNRAARNRKK